MIVRAGKAMLVVESIPRMACHVALAVGVKEWNKLHAGLGIVLAGEVVVDCLSPFKGCSLVTWKIDACRQSRVVGEPFPATMETSGVDVVYEGFEMSVQNVVEPFFVLVTAPEVDGILDGVHLEGTIHGGDLK